MHLIYATITLTFANKDKFMSRASRKVGTVFFCLCWSLHFPYSYSLFVFCHGMEQGRRNSVVVGRDGFEELYMFSPGSSHEFYGKYAYICVGQSAVLKPIILGPNESWTGGQRLHNPNL